LNRKPERDFDLLKSATNSVVKELVRNNVLQPNAHLTHVEDVIMRAIEFFNAIDFNEINTGETVKDKIRKKEIEIEMDMFIREPTSYVMSWKECWDKQKFLRDEKWLRDIEESPEEELWDINSWSR
jgi:hypothetical protein